MNTLLTFKSFNCCKKIQICFDTLKSVQKTILLPKGRMDGFKMGGIWKIATMQTAIPPEKAATAFTEVTSHLLGATYTPVLYIAVNSLFTEQTT